MTKSRFGFLSNNELKILAAILMVCDHLGMMIFTKTPILRDIGRLSFPLFAYLIAEGAKYTRNKLRHLLTMAGFAAVIQIGYYIFNQSLEMSVLVTFTLSLLIIYALDLFKSALFQKDGSVWKIALTAALLLGAIALALTLHHLVDLDYNFSGCILPVFPSILTKPKVADAPAVFDLLDRKEFRIFATLLGALALSFDFGGSQFLCLLAIPLLFLYSENPGKLKMKYFFYIFYPLHFVVIYAIGMLIN